MNGHIHLHKIQHSDVSNVEKSHARVTNPVLVMMNQRIMVKTRDSDLGDRVKLLSVRKQWIKRDLTLGRI